MTGSLPSRRFTGLRTLIPGITAAILLADVALRVLPLERFAFRAWEPMTLDAVPDAAFVANRRYENGRAYGDLSAVSNRPAMRELRREGFTTDAHGFRNPPGALAAGPPDVIVFGDSFAAGSGVNDDETLTAQIGRITGRRVYNAAGRGVTAEFVRAWLDKLNMRRGVVVCQFSEPWDEETAGKARGAHALTFPPLDLFLRTSRLRLLMEAGRKRLESDGVLPNPSRDRARALPLRNGATMLFLSEDLTLSAPGPRDARDAATLVEIARMFTSADLRVVLLLVPKKYAVYGPLVAGTSGVSRDAVGKRLRAVADAARAAGVVVVNVTDDLQRAAEDGLPTGTYVYRMDDTHWNATGIRLAAERLRHALQP